MRSQLWTIANINKVELRSRKDRAKLVSEGGPWSSPVQAIDGYLLTIFNLIIRENHIPCLNIIIATIIKLYVVSFVFDDYSFKMEW